MSQKQRLHPCIVNLIWLGLQAARTATPYPDISHEVPAPLHGAINHQAQIRWEQLYYGRVSKEWANAIDTMHPELLPTGMQIMSQIMRKIWSTILKKWKVQNTHHHQNAAELDTPNYQQAIATLYKQWHQLPPAAQDALYQQPLEELLDQPAPRLQTWAQHGHRYFTQQLRAAKTQARLRTQDIRNFFQQTTQPTDDLQPP